MHRIRLREPWRCTTAGDEPFLAFERPFNRPTGLTPNQRVVIAIRGHGADTGAEPRLWINNHPLLLESGPTDASWISCCILPHLALHNRIRLEIPAATLSPTTCNANASGKSQQLLSATQEPRAPDRRLRLTDAWEVTLWILDAPPTPDR